MMMRCLGWSEWGGTLAMMILNRAFDCQTKAYIYRYNALSGQKSRQIFATNGS